MILFGMDLGPHWAFIVAAYLAAIIVVVALLAWVTIDYGMQKRRLADLAARGVRRRSVPVPAKNDASGPQP